MAVIPQHRITQLKLAIEAYKNHDFARIDKNNLTEIKYVYFKILTEALQIPTDEAVSGKLMNSLNQTGLSNLFKLIQRFFRTQTPMDELRLISISPLTEEAQYPGTTEENIRQHFTSYYPEIELFVPMQRVNHQFIMGALLALSGIILIITALAMSLTAGVVAPVVVGALGALGMFAGSAYIAERLAGRENLDPVPL